MYEGCVRSFDKLTGKHLVLYDDDEEESLDLAKEKIEWVQETGKKFKRLRRGFSASNQMVIEEVEGADNVDVGAEESHDDSSDEDWRKNENEVPEDAEDADEDMELEDEEDVAERPKGKRGGKFEPTKRKLGGGEKLGPAKRSKSAVEFVKGSFKVSSSEPTNNSESKW